MIDYQELEQALKDMQPRQKLYELVKAEMLARKRWKPLSRGKVFNKGYDKRRNKLT